MFLNRLSKRDWKNCSKCKENWKGNFYSFTDKKILKTHRLNNNLWNELPTMFPVSCLCASKLIFLIENLIIMMQGLTTNRFQCQANKIFIQVWFSKIAQCDAEEYQVKFSFGDPCRIYLLLVLVHLCCYKRHNSAKIKFFKTFDIFWIELLSMLLFAANRCWQVLMQEISQELKSKIVENFIIRFLRDF